MVIAKKKPAKSKARSTSTKAKSSKAGKNVKKIAGKSPKMRTKPKAKASAKPKATAATSNLKASTSGAKPKTLSTSKSKTASARSNAAKPKAKAPTAKPAKKPTSSSTQSRSSSRPKKSSTKPRRATASKPRQASRKGIVSTVVNTVTGFFGSGQTNAIDILKNDHDTVETLFESVKENEGGNNVERFKQIKGELDTHTHIEEEIFYPYLFQRGDDDLKQMVREAFEEHAQAKDLLKDLASMMRDTPDFNAKLKVLRENIEHHVAEEEDEMFPLVEDQIGSDTLQKLGAELQAEKERFKRGNTPRSAEQQRSAEAR